MYLKSESFYNFRNLFYTILRKNKNDLSRTELEVMDILCFKIYTTLLKKYTASSRKYHTMQHIQDCLTEFKSARRLFKNPNEAEMALWFHDSVYNKVFNTSFNEIRSFELFSKLFKSTVKEFTKFKIKTFICFTKETVDEDKILVGLRKDCALVRDIDRSILGQVYLKFKRYRKGIREEYWFIPYFIFKKKEILFLKSLLERDHIYETTFFRNKYEEKARKNIALFLKELGEEID